MQATAIVLLAIASAVLFGIVHDQVTARICVEYFTIGHPPVFDTQSPTLLGIGWGIIATWWMGLILGVPLAGAARMGCRPKRDVRSLVRPVGILLVSMALCAAIAGLIGYLLADAGFVFLIEPLASQVPKEKHTAFLTDLWAHSASYVAGLVGGIAVIVHVFRSRARPSNAT